MCTNLNNTPTNPDNFNEKKAVYEEMHNWFRHINNSIWLITSFFIGLNLVVIKTVLSDSENSKIKDFLEYLTYGEKIFLTVLIFTTLWLIPALCVLSLMAISAKLSSLLERESNSLQMRDLCRESGFKFWRLADLKKLLIGMIFPYGWITVTFTILFISVWIWIFRYFTS